VCLCITDSACDIVTQTSKSFCSLNVVNICHVATEAHMWIFYWGKHMKVASFKSIREHQKVDCLARYFLFC